MYGHYIIFYRLCKVKILFEKWLNDINIILYGDKWQSTNRM